MLEVIIRGPYNSGKTSLASIIAKALSEANAQVSVDDMDKHTTLVAARAPQVVSGKTVVIRVEQVPRNKP